MPQSKNTDAHTGTDMDADTLTQRQTWAPRSRGVSKQAFFSLSAPVLGHPPSLWLLRLPAPAPRCRLRSRTRSRWRRPTTAFFWMFEVAAVFKCHRRSQNVCGRQGRGRVHGPSTLREGPSRQNECCEEARLQESAPCSRRARGHT